MPRTSRSPAKRARHKKWLTRAKGFRGRRKTVFKIAKEAVLKAGKYAYRDRRKKKADIRAIWQVHINAAVRKSGLSYSQFMSAVRVKKIGLNRKMLAHLAQKHPTSFKHIVDTIKTK